MFFALTHPKFRIRLTQRFPMSRTAEQIRQDAMALPLEQRTRLAEDLLASVTPDSAAIQAAWVEEAERRMQRYRAGQTTAVPVEEAIDEIERLLREKRK
jgi:putative addiction module component (TIGR02574 family)